MPKTPNLLICSACYSKPRRRSVSSKDKTHRSRKALNTRNWLKWKLKREVLESLPSHTRIDIQVAQAYRRIWRLKRPTKVRSETNLPTWKRVNQKNKRGWWNEGESCQVWGCGRYPLTKDQGAIWSCYWERKKTTERSGNIQEKTCWLSIIGSKSEKKVAGSAIAKHRYSYKCKKLEHPFK